MKIHSDVLTAADVYNATKAAGMTGVYADTATRGSRSRAARLDVKLTGTSNRAPNFGTSKTVDRFGSVEKAATWDEWGMFLNALYNIDPDMLTDNYENKGDFDYKTDWRYNELTADAQHKNHKWEWVCVGEYMCECGAVRRR